MTQRLRLKDIAEAAGVSQGTVSNCFNRPDVVRPAVRDKVLEVADKLGYQGPNAAARQLRTGKSDIVGVMIPRPLEDAVSDPVLIDMIRGIAEICDKASMGLLLLPAENAEATRRSLSKAAVDGLIVHCLQADMDTIELALRQQLRVVTVDQEQIDDIPSVEIADRKGASCAAEHLLAFGHRRIGVLSLKLARDDYVGPVDAARREKIAYNTGKERLAGYYGAVERARMPPETLVVEEMPSGRENAAAATHRLLDRSPDITAIMAMSDIRALGALDAAKARGLSVPGDLSLIGFDGIPDLAVSDPPISTISQPLRDKGRLAATVLLHRKGPARLILPTTLIDRGSTRPVEPSDWTWPAEPRPKKRSARKKSSRPPS